MSGYEDVQSTGDNTEGLVESYCVHAQAACKLWNTHFLFYKNVKPQLWGYLKNICIAEIAKVVYF